MINIKRNNEKPNGIKNFNSQIKKNKTRNFIHRKNLSEIENKISKETNNIIYEFKNKGFDYSNKMYLIDYDYEFLESISKKNKKRNHFRTESAIEFESTRINNNRKYNLVIPKLDIKKLTIPLKKQLKIITPRTKNEENCFIF